MTLPTLADAFRDDAHRLGASDPDIERAWRDLTHAYTDRSRTYHTLDHLAAMFEALDRFAPDVARDPVLRFAVWYHDIDYVATRSDNESESARSAHRALTTLGATDAMKAHVERAILSTAKHDAAPGDPLIDALLDADLSILGAPTGPYDEYAAAIRREYRLVPAPLYRRGRRKVLESFLSRGELFRLPAFREAFEARARENLRRELASLA